MAWGVATAEIDGELRACLLADGAVIPLDASLPSTGTEIVSALAMHRPALERARSGRPAPNARLLAPLLYPGKVLCAGANYYDHMAEMGFPGAKKESQRLFFFMKPPRNAVVGPGATVPMPRHTASFDWEVELAAVIGRTARYVTPDAALDHVAGYTVAIDLSARDQNRAPDQFYKFDWVAGKGGDAGCPLGPAVVPADLVGDPQNLWLKLWVNGELKQDSSTAQMIYGVAEQVARASEIMTLDPGDVILTGTPAGVGAPKGTFLAVGDRVAAEIEGLGRLEVTIGPG